MISSACLVVAGTVRSLMCNHGCLPFRHLAPDISGAFYSTPFVGFRIPCSCKVPAPESCSHWKGYIDACLLEPAADRNECWVEPDIPRCQGRVALWVVDRVQGILSWVAILWLLCRFQRWTSLEKFDLGVMLLLRFKPQQTERLRSETSRRTPRYRQEKDRCAVMSQSATFYVGTSQL